MLTSFILTQTAHWFFTRFIQEILFLKLLLSLIEGGGSYKEYVLLVLMFAASGLIAKATDCITDYLVCTRMKYFYKNLNDRIFRKAVNVDIACFENPEFYNKYKRATEIITNDHSNEFAYNFASMIAGGLTGIFLIAYVTTIDPKILLILLVAVFVSGFDHFSCHLVDALVPRLSERKVVRRAVAERPLLHLLDELDFVDIAEIMNIKASTVRSQYVRGLEKLRKSICYEYRGFNKK